VREFVRRGCIERGRELEAIRHTCGIREHRVAGHRSSGVAGSLALKIGLDGFLLKSECPSPFSVKVAETRDTPGRGRGRQGPGNDQKKPRNYGGIRRPSSN
jgi:hypothetical protein